MHDCCYCGCACYCHGDIDDCPVEVPQYAYDHCEGCGCEEEPEDIEDMGWGECGGVERLADGSDHDGENEKTQSE